MFKVSTETYKELLKIHDSNKVPLYVYGAPGIGKSAIPRQVFGEVAEAENRRFVEWSHLSMDEKRDAKANPDKYFVFMDMRLSQCDVSELRGIPNMASPEMLEYMPLSWVTYFVLEGSRGVIFFDEMNLAPPLVSGQAYQIIHDRVVSDRKISDGVFIFCAGNRAIDMAHVYTMPFPLRDRFSEIEISIDDEVWCNWAMQNDINPYLISFIKFKPSLLYTPSKDTEDKGTTPRSVERASRLIDRSGLPINSPMIKTLTSCAAGEAFSIEFFAYIEIACKIDIEVLMKNPKSVMDFKSADKWFAVCGILSDHIRKYKAKDEKSKLIFGIAHEMPVEYSVVALNMISGSYGDKVKFKQALLQYPRCMELLERSAKFVSL